jgi:hypothetical protein
MTVTIIKCGSKPDDWAFCDEVISAEEIFGAEEIRVVNVPDGSKFEHSLGYDHAPGTKVIRLHRTRGRAVLCLDAWELLRFAEDTLHGCSLVGLVV